MTLATTKVMAHTVMMTVMTTATVVREFGLTKFGTCPSGGAVAGTAQRSTPGGSMERDIVIGDHEQLQERETMQNVYKFVLIMPHVQIRWMLIQIQHLGKNLALLMTITDSRSAAASAGRGSD
jgi:hypothetical protein